MPLLQHVHLNTLRQNSPELFYAVMMDGLSELCVSGTRCNALRELNWASPDPTL